MLHDSQVSAQITQSYNPLEVSMLNLRRLRGLGPLIYRILPDLLS